LTRTLAADLEHDSCGTTCCEHIGPIEKRNIVYGRHGNTTKGRFLLMEADSGPESDNNLRMAFDPRILFTATALTTFKLFKDKD
jgi:hypothetical protein